VALQAVLCLVGKEEMRRRKAVAAPVSLRWQAHRPSDNGISSL